MVLSRTCYVPVLTYVSESWTMRRREKCKKTGFGNEMFSESCRRDRRRNEVIGEEVEEGPLIEQNRL